MWMYMYVLLDDIMVQYRLINMHVYVEVSN